MHVKMKSNPYMMGWGTKDLLKGVMVRLVMLGENVFCMDQRIKYIVCITDYLSPAPSRHFPGRPACCLVIGMPYQRQSRMVWCLLLHSAQSEIRIERYKAANNPCAVATLLPDRTSRTNR